MKRNLSFLEIRRLLQFARAEIKTLSAGTFFLVVASTTGLLYPQIIRRIVDESLKAGHGEAVDRAALWVMVILFVQAIAGAIRYYLFTIAGERIVLNLRQSLFQHLMVQEIAFFDSRRTGELMSRLASDTTVLQNTLSVNISMTLRSLATGIGGVALLFYTSPILAMLVIAVVPPIALSGALFGRSIKKLSRQTQDSLANAGTVAEETLSGMRTVRAFAQENFEVGRYGKSLQESYQVAQERIRQIGFFTAGVSLVAYAAAVAVLWHGGRLVVQSRLSIGDLTSFLIYMGIVGFSFGALGSLWTDFMGAIGAAKRLFEIFDRIPTISVTGGDKLSKVEGRITFEKVSFHYPSRPDANVLSEVSFTIEPGTVVALVGPSGGGKSTIAGLIPRFYDPTKGQVTIDGHSVKNLDGSWWREQIGIVSQEPTLLSETIGQNIRYGNHEASLEDIRNAARTANALDFIEQFPQKYETLVGEKGIQLSAGQKQRIAIARAILKNPRLLILDEATSSLDAESEALVKEALDRLMKSRTTLVIAHRLSTVRDASVVLVVEHGKIVQRGDHQKLMGETSGLYRKLIERQFIAR